MSTTVTTTRDLRLAGGLHAAGVRAGHRVSLLIGPGPTRRAAVAACGRIGAVVVAASPHLTERQQVDAHTTAAPHVVLGDRRGLRLTRRLRTPFLRVAAEPLNLADRWALGVGAHLDDLVDRHLLVALPEPPTEDDDAALVFVPSDRADEAALGIHYSQADLAALAVGGAPAALQSTGARAASVRVALDLLGGLDDRSPAEPRGTVPQGRAGAITRADRAFVPRVALV